MLVHPSFHGEREPMNKDSAGYRVSGASGASLDAFEKAAHQLRCYIGDPVASVDEALAASPGMTMAHVLKAWLHLLGTEPGGLPVARQCLQAASRLQANARERGHLEAIALLLEGRWRAAGRVLEDVSVQWPRDALALQAGHQIDFFTGDARMLRDRIARALPTWSASQPGYHALLGMHAFGLEECGDYLRAEKSGREAIERERRDTWAWHAVAHVMEMGNRSASGIEWLRTDTSAWAEDSFFAVHNWWHLALFHLDRGEIDAALALFDGPVHGARSTVALDMVDAAALLWRLHLRGVDVHRRWQSVADGWATVAGAGNYAFNEWHAMMAFVGADRPKAQQAVLDSLRLVAAGADDAAAFAREVGLSAALAVHAFGDERYAEAVELLRPLRGVAHRFGGSHAQRDLIDLTLIEAALRSGQGALARALAAERTSRFPASPLARLFARRAARVQEPAAAREVARSAHG